MKNMNNDLISRQAAIEIVERYDKSHMALKQRPMLGAASIVMELEDLPSVQTEKMQLSEEDATKGTTFDYIDRQAAIDALDALCDRECEYSKQQRSFMCGACRLGSAFDVIDELPSVQPEKMQLSTEKTQLSEEDATKEIQDILEYLDTVLHPIISPDHWNVYSELHDMISMLPSAQPEQRYTEEELRVFQHGISLSLLSKRSSQHWQYDEDTATEIKFLERLYEKVSADMRGAE